MITVVVPCVDARYLAPKLENLQTTLGALAPQTLVCFNGPAEGEAEVASLVSLAAKRGCDVELVCTPAGKNHALRAGLQRARFPCIFSTDVDCYIVRNAAPERWQALAARAAAGAVVAFPVLTAPPRDGPGWRARLQDATAAMFSLIGLRFHRVRGGGWLGPDYREFIDPAVQSDDLHYPMSLRAQRHGGEIMARDIVIVEDPASLGDYPAKIPRLMFGAWQALCLAETRRNRLSILVQKIVPYAVVALAPLAVGLGLSIAATAGSPVWAWVGIGTGALVVLLWKRRIWLGCLRGWAAIVIGRTPRW